MILVMWAASQSYTGTAEPGGAHAPPPPQSEVGGSTPLPKKTQALTSQVSLADLQQIMDGYSKTVKSCLE